MVKKLLGLRLCEHDSNISYFDGENVHYIKTERIYKTKHHGYNNLYDWEKDIFKLFNVKSNDIDEVAIIIDPWRHNQPTNNEEFFPHYDYKFFPHKNTIRLNHHLAHALSCWPIYNERPEYEIVIDGFGDQNNAWTVFKNNRVLERGYTTLHGSLGMAMCHVGMVLKIGGENEIYDIASKLMGFQAYGKLIPEFKEKLNYDLYSINRLFDFSKYNEFIGDELLAHWNSLDWIKTVHDKASDILVKFFENITKNNYDAKISYSGGVAQNVVWNTALKNKFKNLIIPPHCNDEGLSLGALEYLRIKNNLKKFKLNNFPYIQSDNSPETEPDHSTIEKTANYLKEGLAVAWYQGNGEIGPRALGNRSLLFNPLIKNGKDIINKIKKREPYRPFGASILKEHVGKYFNTNIDNPFMLLVGNIKSKNFPSITHIDNSCRFQSVDKEQKIYYNLINEFYKKTNIPMLLNTSLNSRGKPIMSSVTDAIEYFKNSKIDVLVVGNKIYKK